MNIKKDIKIFNENLKASNAKYAFIENQRDIYNDEPIFAEHIMFGNDVKEIPDFAYEQRTFSKIILGDNIESIGERAFYSSKIESLYIPDSVKSIEDNVFDLSI